MDEDPKAIFTREFIARVKAAREDLYSQLEMARLLRLPLDTYKQYESNALLPHHLLLRFCLATGTDPFVLLGGHRPPCLA